MPLYRLDEIMKMLRDQRFRRYQGINVLLNIFDDEKTSPSRKKFVIIAGLRAIGLFEIGYSGNRGRDEGDDAPSKNKWKKKSVKVPMQLFRCNLMNAIVQFDLILN